MKKVFRYSFLFILSVILFILIYSTLPFIVWVFGGSFKEVSQSIPYVIIGSTFCLIFIGILLSECFDTEGFEK